MNLALDDMRVLVTGASGGIGWATTEAFAAEGAALRLHANTRGEALRDRASSRWDARIESADLRDPTQVQAMMDAFVGETDRVDVLVVNAGIWPAASLRLDQMSLERIHEVLDINLRGAMWCARAFMAALGRTGPRPDGRGASICLVGSTAGRFGEAGHSAYAVSKAGLLGLVRTLKNEIVELDPLARVNMVEPGWTATPMARSALDQPGAIERTVRTMALQQIARPEDVARAILMLSSPALSRHVSGEVLTVAGGMEGRVIREAEGVDAALVRRRLQSDD
jgi:3-oxoacyl-[acyl-carrier protein] reductase